MITGIGTDIVDLRRIERILSRSGGRFVTRVFSAGEIRRADASEVGAKFAAKEAFVKALGTGFRGVAFRDIEVLNDSLGRPFYRFSRRLAEKFGLDEVNVHLTMSHERDYAVAVAVVETR